MELASVDWEAPETWPTQITEILSSPSADGEVRFDLSTDDPRVLDIVALTSDKGAQVIMDQHRIASRLEEWTTQANRSHLSEDISSAEAEAAVLFGLETHFGANRDNIDTMDSRYEPGAEYQIHIKAGPQQFIGTARREGALQLTHLVNQTDL